MRHDSDQSTLLYLDINLFNDSLHFFYDRKDELDALGTPKERSTSLRYGRLLFVVGN